MTTITTLAELEALPDQAVIRDRFGDIGIVEGDRIHYPEACPEAFQRVVEWAPLTVLWPLPAPTVKPGREEVARAIYGTDCAPWRYLDTRSQDYWLTLADAVLAILPGKTEQEVRAEALRDAATTLRAQLNGGPGTPSSGYVTVGQEFLGALNRRADEEAGK